MRKLLIALAAVATIGIAAPVATSTPADAQGWHGHRHHGWHGHRHHHRGWHRSYGFAPRVVVVPPRYGYRHHHHRHHWGAHRGYYGW